MPLRPEDVERELVLARCAQQLRDKPGHYAFLLGAGISNAAGIPLGGAIVTMLRERLLNDLQRDVSPAAGDEMFQQLGWFQDPETAYSEALLRAFSSDHERQRFFRELIVDKMPTLAHYYLASIIASGHCNLILTTNFDNLLEKALTSLRFDEFNVITHAASTEYVTAHPDVVTLVKLHGHYTFPQLANLADETAQLSRQLREYFEYLMRDYGLIVAGYAGRDRSIMEPITRSVRGRTVPKGVIWCVRGDGSVERAPYLRELERTGAGSVRFLRIQDMDDFYRDLHERLGLPDDRVLDALSAERYRYQRQKLLQRLSTGMSLDQPAGTVDEHLRYLHLRRHDELDMTTNDLRSTRRLLVRNDGSVPVTLLTHAEYGENKITHADLRASGHCVKTGRPLEFRPLQDPSLSFCRAFEMRLPRPIEPGEEAEIEYALSWPGEPAHYGQQPHSQSVSLIRYRRGVSRLQFSVTVKGAPGAPMTRAWAFGLNERFQEHQIMESLTILDQGDSQRIDFEADAPTDWLYVLYYVLGPHTTTTSGGPAANPSAGTFPLLGSVRTTPESHRGAR
jgi:hypothetical protein